MSRVSIAKKNEFLALMKSKSVMERLSAVIPDCNETTLIRFLNRVMTEAKRNPKILTCDPSSILDACVTCAQINLNPDSLLGQAYFIPRRDQLTVMVGYKGLLKLAYRSVKGLQHVEAHIVYEGEKFDVTMGSTMSFSHVFDISSKQRGNPQKIVGVYAIVTYENGNKVYEIMTRNEVEAIKSRSQAAKSGFSPWTTDYGEMAKKTVIRRILKTCDMETDDLMRAITVDEQQEYKYKKDDETIIEAVKSEVKEDFLGISS